MSWKGLERNKLDFILTDLLPVEVSELFSFYNFYKFLLKKENQEILDKMIEEIKIKKATHIPKAKMFESNWSAKPLKYNILKNNNSYREMSIINPFSAINLYLFMECYQKDILDFLNKNHYYSIRYHKKNINLYYKNRKGKTLEYFQNQICSLNKNAIQQVGNYFKIAPFESINAFNDSRLWRTSNFQYKFYAKMDYKSCFDSIYTHVFSWIIERDVIDSKNATSPHLFITIDRILQNINGRASNGIVVGPEFSRMIAEILLQQIDSEIFLFLAKENIIYKKDYMIFRYVDDIYIFAHEQTVLEKIIKQFKNCSERYRLHLNDFKTTMGETPALPKDWLEKARLLSDSIGNMFYNHKKSEYKKLPPEKQYMVKSDFFYIDKLKDEISVIMKIYITDKRTIVSFLLSTLLNNISKKKDGFTLFSDKNKGKAILFIDLAFYIYAFFPSFDQTRKMISIITYINKEIDFKNCAQSHKKLANIIHRYEFIFQNGTLHDQCDWFPFFKEFDLTFEIKTETILIEAAKKLNDPIIWGNLLLYSQYDTALKQMVLDSIEKILNKCLINFLPFNEPLMQIELWYFLVFHNCPYITPKIQNEMEKIICDIKNSLNDKHPSEKSLILLCDFLMLKSQNGNKPKNSFFNWEGYRDIGNNITFRTHQRTVFKHYRKNTYRLYSSIE